jgi:hypothetical protein
MRMEYWLPSEFKQLPTMIGDKIIKAKRQILISDKNIPYYEQNADGPIEIRLKSGLMFHIISHTEGNSILIKEGQMPKYEKYFEEVNVSENSFWKVRLNKTIKNIFILKSLYAEHDNPSEFGIELLFDDSNSLIIEYLDEEDWPDMMRITGRYEGPSCKKINVEQSR